MLKQNDLHDAGTLNVVPMPNIGNGAIPVKFLGAQKVLYGGPYRQRPSYLPGVKLAVEIKEPCDISCPIRDFSIPTTRDATAALAKTLQLLVAKDEVYIGCMGGWGRTGVFLSLLVKTLSQFSDDVEDDPVRYVRAIYSHRAVETSEQEQFVGKYNAKLLAKVWRWL